MTLRPFPHDSDIMRPVYRVRGFVSGWTCSGNTPAALNSISNEIQALPRYAIDMLNLFRPGSVMQGNGAQARAIHEGTWIL
jgi:hypothetical protein